MNKSLFYFKTQISFFEMSFEMFQSIYQTLEYCGNGRRHFNILATKQKASKPTY